jgi:hypothetical protein
MAPNTAIATVEMSAVLNTVSNSDQFMSIAVSKEPAQTLRVAGYRLRRYRMRKHERLFD